MEEKHGPSDHELLRRIAGRDEAALAELVDRHEARCLRRARAVLRDPVLAEDAVQEAFLDLWRTADRFDRTRAEPVVWLCVLVHRRAVDLTRREARRRVLESSQPRLDRSPYTAEEEVLLLLERRDVQRALAGLSDPQRTVVELAYYGGLTQSEVARRLEVPLGTIKSRMATALGRLSLALAT